MKHLYGKLTCCFVLFILLCVTAWSEDRLTRTSHIDWEAGKLNISFQINFDTRQNSVLKGRQMSEVRVREELPFAIQGALIPVRLDSYTLFEDIIKTDPSLLLLIEELAEKSAPLRSHLSPRLDFYRSDYAFSLYPEIVSLLPLHEVPQSMQGLLDWEATTDFTGIVIYMKGEYPIWGTREQGKLEPSFFPKIFDENMNLVFSKDMMDPEIIRERGMCSYAEATASVKNNWRAGHSPFTTMGTALFGKYHTDIIITEKAARKLLYSEHNRNLLKNGQILIICDLETD